MKFWAMMQVNLPELKLLMQYFLPLQSICALVEKRVTIGDCWCKVSSGILPTIRRAKACSDRPIKCCDLEAITSSYDSPLCWHVTCTTHLCNQAETYWTVLSTFKCMPLPDSVWLKDQETTWPYMVTKGAGYVGLAVTSIGGCEIGHHCSDSLKYIIIK